MITKEEFLKNTTEEEVFSFIHEIKERINDKLESNPYFLELSIADETIAEIAKDMIIKVKESIYI